jgi:hypothetical protein
MNYFDRIPEIIGALIPLLLFVVIPVLTIFRAIRNRGNSNKYNSQKSDSWNNSSFDDMYSNPRYSTYACNLYYRSSDDHHRHHD